MPDFHGTSGRDDLVGGGSETQFSTTVEGVTLCSVEPFTDEEIDALREYFRLLAEKRRAEIDDGRHEFCETCGEERLGVRFCPQCGDAVVDDER